MGLVSGKRHPCDSSSHLWKRQRLSGQGVQRIQGHERVEVCPNNYSTLSAELSDGSARESSNQLTHGLHQLETRPWKHLHRSLYDKLGSSTGLCPPPPFNLISKTLTKVTIDKTDLILFAPVWEAPALVADSAETSMSQPVLLPNGPTLLKDPIDLNRVHPMYPRLSLAVFHISTNVSKLRAFQQTLPIYSLQLLVPPPRRISERKIDHLSSSISEFLIFLTELFNKCLAYRSPIVLRSAISSSHPKIDGFFSGSASLLY